MRLKMECRERSVRFSGEPIKVHMQTAVMTDTTKHHVLSRSRSFFTAMPLRSQAQLGRHLADLLPSRSRRAPRARIRQ
jgi:hypothetical protein